jgi:hypothetical protein
MGRPARAVAIPGPSEGCPVGPSGPVAVSRAGACSTQMIPIDDPATDRRPAPAATHPSATDALAPSPGEAARLLEDLGFLVHSDLPDRAGPAFLLVALRAHPALRHFDPEVVEWWTTQGGRGRRARMTRSSPLPLDAPVAWGDIRILDRTQVANEFVTFGGRISAEPVDDDTLIVAVTSSAPILRKGGHSQSIDLAAEQAGAFFARVLLAVDYVSGLEAALGSATPSALYGAFLVDLVGRLRAGPNLRDAVPALWSVARSELAHLEETAPDDVAAARTLLAAIAGV